MRTAREMIRIQPERCQTRWQVQCRKMKGEKDKAVEETGEKEKAVKGKVDKEKATRKRAAKEKVRLHRTRLISIPKFKETVE